MINKPAGAKFRPKRSLKVLVAEDNVINQRVAVGLLSQLGHTGVVVSDGAKALKCLSALPFDVVLMDVMMPHLDGLEALATLRRNEELTGAAMPVVMATAHDQPGDSQRFIQAGAQGYVRKPIELEALHNELERVTA